MSLHFIAGAGTDIGKTYITCLLIRRAVAGGRTVVALKPVASGVPALGSPAFAGTDTAQILAALGSSLTAAEVEMCSPWRFEAPLSPDMAAAAEGRSVTLEALMDWTRARIEASGPDALVLIEGVGGVMSPMTSDALNLDVIKALGGSLTLVAGSYLGAVNHALTALETLKAHGVPARTVVVNESEGSTVDFDATLATLRRFAPEPPLIAVRRGATTIDLDLA